MPSKKKKYNARFPAGRIKKIMQSDEEVGKVAQAVPIIISRTLELFVESLLTKTLRITNSRNAKTLSPSHMKQCIMSENRFDFLRELVKNIPDISVADETGNDSCSPPSLHQSGGQHGLIIAASSPPPSSSSSSSPFIDNSMQPYDLSINKQLSSSAPSATNGNTTTSAATAASIRNGGISINIKAAAAAAATGVSSPPSSAGSNSSVEFRAELKRQWDNVHACRKQLSEKNLKNSKENSSSVIQHTSDSNDDGCTPAKLARMDSLPNTTATTTTANYEKMRRLQHQSKSVPCSSKESSYHHQLSSSSSLSSTTSNLPPLIPAPIVSTENICNKPVVKIDYSNLALHDNELLSTTTTISSPSINSGDSNSNQNNIITTTTATPAVNITINPVINIDLSNITPLPIASPTASSSSTAKVKITTTAAAAADTIEIAEGVSSGNSGGKSTTTAILSPLPTTIKHQKPALTLNSQNNSSNLELDEDYDNI